MFLKLMFVMAKRKCIMLYGLRICIGLLIGRQICRYEAVRREYNADFKENLELTADRNIENLHTAAALRHTVNHAGLTSTLSQYRGPQALSSDDTWLTHV